MLTISIVIPTFRRPHYLAQALASIAAQRLPEDVELDVLVCDNAADAQTAALVAATRDPRIVHVPRPRNLGMMRNAVAGFAQARGDYVLKFDDDDLLHPDALAELVRPLRDDPDLAVTFGSFDLIDEEGRPLRERTIVNEAYSGRSALHPGRYEPFDRLVLSGAIGMVCALVRRTAVDWADVPDDVATAYDRHIALQSARNGAAAWYVGGPLASYRIHDRSDSAVALTRQALGSLRATERALAAGAHVDRSALLEEAQHAALRAARLLLREDTTGSSDSGASGTPSRHTSHADESPRRILLRALRRRPDAEILRLSALAALPRPAARAIALRRLARHEHQLRQIAGTSGITTKPDVADVAVVTEVDGVAGSSTPAGQPRIE